MGKMSEHSSDDWGNMAGEYAKMTAETSSRPIGVLLDRANALWPLEKATGILDNGCGPGPVMTRLLKDYQIPDSCALTCSDWSDGMIKTVNTLKDKKIAEDSNSPWKGVETVVQDAMDLKSIKDESRSHVTAGWVYFMTPDPQKCLSESKRVLKDGGVLSCSSWQGSQWMDLMSLVPKVRPEKVLPEIPPAWMDVDLLKGELEKAGFKDVESHKVETSMSFEKMDQIVDFFLSKIPHMVMMTKDFSDAEKTQLRDLCIEEGKRMCPDEPGRLTGTALVATGRK